MPLHRNNVVALLAEGVDRNIRKIPGESEIFPSPAARRAWIEKFSASTAT